MPARSEPHPKLLAHGQRIRELRKARGMSLKTLASLIAGSDVTNHRGGGCGVCSLSNIECGRSGLTFVRACAIAEALGVSVAVLAGEAPIPEFFRGQKVQDPFHLIVTVVDTPTAHIGAYIVEHNGNRYERIAADLAPLDDEEVPNG